MICQNYFKNYIGDWILLLRFGYYWLCWCRRQAWPKGRRQKLYAGERWKKNQEKIKLRRFSDKKLKGFGKIPSRIKKSFQWAYEPF